MVYVSNSAEPRARNTSKACEECRRRKQKCNGENPCNICKKRRASCFYRAVTRHRALRTGVSKNMQMRNTEHIPSSPSNSNNEHESSHAVTDTDMDQLQTTLPRKHIFSSIRATHISRGFPSCLSELSFGPTSNVSILRHFHAHFEPTRITSSSSFDRPDEIHDGNESIDMFGYRERAFGPLLRQEDLDSTFLQYELAQSFLDGYLSTTHYHVPILPAELLQSLLEQLYEPSTDITLSIPQRAITYVTMAIGATNKHDVWRAILLAKAVKEAEKIKYEIHLHAVQVELLLIRTTPPSSKFYLIV